METRKHSEKTKDKIEGVSIMSNPYRINLHVILAGDDNDVTVYPPGKNVSTVETLVDNLNMLFSHIDIQFDFDASTDLEEIRNTVVNNDYALKGNLANAMERHRMARKNNDKITMLFRDGEHQVASNFSSNTTYLVVLQKGSLTRAPKVMHELGHYLHLSHTHTKEAAREDVVKKIREYVEDNGHPLSDGLKALEVYYDGDTENVHDTPYDLGAKIYGTTKAACADNAELTFEVVFNNGGTAHPHVASKQYAYIPKNRSNPMSYFVSCGFPLAFSANQQTAIHNGLLSGNRIRLLRGSDWDSANQQEFVSPAAVSRHADTVAVFASNQDGEMMTKVWDSSRGSYWPSNTSWFYIGGSGYISPIAVSRRHDLIDLSARSIDGKIYSKVWSEARSAYYPSNEGWLDFVGGGGWTDSGPVLLSRSVDALELFVRWIDGTIRRKLWTTDTSNWSEVWQNLGGTGVGSPAAVSRRADLIDLYARWDDGSIRSKVWRAADNSWYPGETGWTNLAGTGYDSPTAVARRPDKIDLFIRWGDGTIRSKTWDDSRGSYWPSNKGWFNLGGQATSKPVAVCRNPASIALFTRWIDGTVRIKVWDDSRDSWWPNNTAWSNLGGNIIGAPAVVAQGENRVVVYCRWKDGTIRSKVWNAETSKWWPGQSAWFSLGRP